MNPITEALIELQRIDDEISEQRQQRHDLASNLERLDSILSHMTAGLEEKEARLKENEQWYKEKQDEMAEDNRRIDESKSKLLSVQRTREYQAMTRELDTLRQRVQGKEKELAQLAEVIETAKAEMKEDEEKLVGIKEESARVNSTSLEQLEKLDAIIEAVNEKKNTLAQNLPPATARLYKRIWAKREGLAVVPAVNGSCQGCRMKVPPQTWVKIQIGKEVFQCAHCSRFLYYTVEESQKAMS